MTEEGVDAPEAGAGGAAVALPEALLAAVVEGFVLMNESYSLDRIIMREWLASRGTGGLVILSAAVTYSRTWVFCFWITWYRVGFSSRVSTWSTFLGRSMSMFSSGSFTEKTDGDGEGLLS